MKNFVENIFANKTLHAKELLDEKLKQLVFEKLDQLKMLLVAEMYEEIGVNVDFEVEELDEANITRQGRTKIIRVRIRGGKVQRRKKLSAVKGYTIRSGKMVRMSSAERRNRKMAARRAKIKRRGKLKQSIRKRRMSLRRRKALGVR